MCCHSGKISLPPLQPVPIELHNLLTSQDPLSKKFRQHIHQYNNALAFTSVGKELDNAINNGGGPYCFRLHGEVIHQAGSLLPREDLTPAFAQLYIYDPDTALNHRMQSQFHSFLDPSTMSTLQDMLYWSRHPAIEQYKQALELTRNMDEDQQCTIALCFTPTNDARTHNTPTANEIVVVLPDTTPADADCQDIILHQKYHPQLERISNTHPYYPAFICKTGNQA